MRKKKRSWKLPHEGWHSETKNRMNSLYQYQLCLLKYNTQCCFDNSKILIPETPGFHQNSCSIQVAAVYSFITHIPCHVATGRNRAHQSFLVHHSQQIHRWLEESSTDTQNFITHHISTDNPGVAANISHWIFIHSERSAQQLETTSFLVSFNFFSSALTDWLVPNFLFSKALCRCTPTNDT